MKTVTEHIRARLLRDLFERLQETEWCSVFERLMRNRLLMGAYRYGLLYDRERPPMNYVKSIRKRAKLYWKTGNQEYLVDIANFALLEFVRKNCHPNPFFSAIDDDGVHVQEVKKSRWRALLNKIRRVI